MSSWTVERCDNGPHHCRALQNAAQAPPMAQAEGWRDGGATMSFGDTPPPLLEK